MNKTTAAGALQIIIAILAAVYDMLQNNFSVSHSLGALILAINGSGFIFLRGALAKLEKLLGINISQLANMISQTQTQPKIEKQ